MDILNKTQVARFEIILTDGRTAALLIPPKVTDFDREQLTDALAILTRAFPDNAADTVAALRKQLDELSNKLGG